MRAARPVATFLAVMILGGGLLSNGRVEALVLRPFTAMVTTVSAAAIRLTGAAVHRDGEHLGTTDGRVRLYVGVDCSGAWAHLVFLAAVLASPATGREKLRGLAFGQPLLFAANILRVVTLYAIASTRPEWLHVVHVYLWQMLIIGIALAIHSLWIETLANAEE